METTMNERERPKEIQSNFEADVDDNHERVHNRQHELWATFYIVFVFLSDAFVTNIFWFN